MYSQIFHKQFFQKLTAVICTIAVTSFLLLPIASAEGEFEDEFWKKGVHFQITGEAIPIAEDGIHDPTNITAMYGLQLPVEAMQHFPRDNAGLLDWVQALKQGHIAPRSDVTGEADALKPLDLDILFTDTGAMPHVLFPHRQHTEWLACKNCHPAVFVQKKGANNIQMNDILTGKFCGLCHGKVAFAPTKNCMRCHSVSKPEKK